jgi:hypothetical protein
MMNIKLRIAIGLAVTGLIAGCGGSGQSASGMAPPPGADAFTQSVQAVVAVSSDTALPVSIEGIATTGSDNAPPVGL